MAPRKKVSAPVGRVYKSQQPLQQVKFPERKKKVKSYGNNATVRVPRLPKQETLTQMDFVKMREQELIQEEEEEEREEEDKIVAAVKPKRKRRRTMEDVEDDANEEEHIDDNKKELKKSNKKRRKTTGDKPSSTPQYHTQTITQLDWSIVSAPEEEDPPEEDDIDTSFDDAIFDVPSSSQAIPPPNKSSKRTIQLPANSPKPDRNTAGKMGPPQTPKRILAQEIPSSESPATPVFLHSATSERSPLRGMSANTPIPFNPNPSRKSPDSAYRLPKLEIQDTFDTATDISQMTRIHTTPSRKSTPAKSVRFAIPELAIPPTEENSHRHPATQPTLIISKSEIMDSDAESDEDYMDNEPAKSEDDDLTEIQDEEAPQPETCYGEFGDETQFEVELILDSPSLSRVEEAQGEEDTPALVEERLMGSPTLTQVVDESQIEDDAEEPVQEEEDEEMAPHYEEKTQFAESQRLATQHFAAMAPRTINSDVFVSLPAQQVTDIINRKRNHDVRNWAYPSTVSRIWIYAAKPVGALKYMAMIGPAKLPGDIEDETGLGNAVFNAKKPNSNWHAYEIIELYELADPLPLTKLIEHEWIQEAPKKHMPVRPAVIDSLMANLMPPIFHQFSDEDAVSSFNDTQEAEAQLLNTMKQFTQIEVSQVAESSQAAQDERIPSSHEEMLPPPYVKPVFNLSQATTVDLSQTQPQSQTPRKLPPTREIIWESPTRPVFSSTPARLPSKVGGSHQDSVVLPYSITSSQMLTKSQMEKEGVMYDSIPAPPDSIQDSDDEDEI